MAKRAPTPQAVVVTGVGIVSPIGVGRETFERNLFSGVVQFTEIDLFDTSAFGYRIAGIARHLEPELHLGRRNLKSLSRSALLACVGTSLAIEEAGIPSDIPDRSRIAVVFGTAFGSLTSVYEFDTEAATEGKRYVDAMNFPNTVMNAPAGYAAAFWGLTGVNVTLSTGFSSGLEAIRHGIRLLTDRQADIVLAGGYEQLSPVTLCAFDRAGYLKRSDSQLPCPFNQHRDGFVPSEGAAIVVLERAEDARRRKAQILANVLGTGIGVDGSRAPQGEKIRAVTEAMRHALQNARVSPGDIDGIIASANGSIEDDYIEAEAIARVFGDRVAVTAPKSIIGETGGASGAIGFACAISSLAHGKLPATLGFTSGGPLPRIKVLAQTTNGIPCERLLVNAVDTSSKNVAVVVGRGSAR